MLLLGTLPVRKNASCDHNLPENFLKSANSIFRR